MAVFIHCLSIKFDTKSPTPMNLFPLFEQYLS